MTRSRAFMGVNLLVSAVAACGMACLAFAQSQSPSPADTFAAQLDINALGRQVAVHSEGRVKSLDSFARNVMQFVTGTHTIHNRTPTFTYLDLMLRPDQYIDADVVFVKNKQMRSDIARVLREESSRQASNLASSLGAAAPADPQLEARLDRFMRTGLISPKSLVRGDVRELLNRLSANVLTSAKYVDALENALGVMNPASLRASLKLVPPPAPHGGFDDPWSTLDDLSNARVQANGAAMEPQLRESLITQWNAFTTGWINLDAPAVNAAAARLASLLPQVNPAIYPEQSRLAWESWYFRAHNMVWVWLLYAVALIPLLLAVVYRWPAARWIGLLLFLVAFGFHTFAVLLRWYVSQRWPNTNMFEAITTASWFGACAALIFEFLVRRTAMRNIFALGSAVAAMTAFMAVHFFPLDLSPNIANKMPVLNDIWLYIHTNVIIFSYCLIFIAAVSAIVYLIYRAIAFTMDLPNRTEFARAGGAASLILTRPDGTSYVDARKSTFGQILDGTTMVVMEMSFILLWAGLVMGAIWADHSWGRPWGWDPKEVFALNTFIVFLVLVHVRLKVKDKGLWTALLAVAGAGVMLFNWIIINFAISGLHSYA